MTDARYFDEDAYDADAGERDVQAMARRQFGISLVVGFALLIAAGLTAVTTLHAAPAPSVEMTARHKIIRIDAPRIEVAQPALNSLPRG
jgi:hypothetical protein